MQYLVYISFGFLGFQLLNVLINFIFRQTIEKTEIQNSELISVLIPARNEENSIGFLLEAMYEKKNDNIEIIICNDYSTDNTEEIIRKYAKIDSRIRIIQSDFLPNGWLGKNHACYQLAKQAKGRYFLFVDADVVLSGNIVADAIAYAKRYKLGLLSVFPKQIQLTAGEKQTVPLMNYILITLLPLIFVRVSPFKSHAAANGQFMLFEAEIYKKWQPHEQFKNSSVEDIAISRFYKSRKIKTACTTGEKRIQCRMYHSYNDALNGFSKNIFMFFGNVPILAFVFWTFSTLSVVPIIIYNFHIAFAYLLAVVFIQIVYAINCQQSVITTVLYFPANMFFMLQVMIKALMVKKQKNYTWKGRNIY
ncbi:MAG: glycosyltransferase family 2 protein [Bacteroidota bacterium]|nr:glycosyltransferase family 2 protein [Bacteroidota bacterium]